MERQAQALATAFQLFRVGVGQQQDELLAAVTGQDVAIAQTGTRHRGEGLQDPIAGGVAVAVVDPLEVIEVDQRQAVLPVRQQVFQRPAGHAHEMPAVEQTGEFVGGHQVFQLAHHAAQRVLVRLQGIAALAHALPHRLYVAGEQAQPDHYDEHHEHLQCSPAR